MFRTHPSRPIRQIFHQLPDHYDPWRRLLAAVTLRSVLDVYQPAAKLSQRDWISATHFLRDQSVKQLLQDMNVSVPWQKIEKLVIEG
ncbi:MAG: hypothetical protein AAF629_00345 [Chloroflexota bacterium]